METPSIAGAFLPPSAPKHATEDSPSERRSLNTLPPASAWRKSSRGLTWSLGDRSGPSSIPRSIQQINRRAAAQLGHGTEIRKTRLKRRRKYHQQSSRDHLATSRTLSQESLTAQQGLSSQAPQPIPISSMPIPKHDTSTPVQSFQLAYPLKRQSDSNGPSSGGRRYQPRTGHYEQDESSGDLPHDLENLSYVADRKMIVSHDPNYASALVSPRPLPMRLEDFGDRQPPGTARAPSSSEKNKLRLDPRNMPKPASVDPSNLVSRLEENNFAQQSMQLQEASTFHHTQQRLLRQRLLWQQAQQEAQDRSALRHRMGGLGEPVLVTDSTSKDVTDSAANDSKAVNNIRNANARLMVKHTISEDLSQGIEANRLEKLRRFHGSGKDCHSTGKKTRTHSL